MNSEDNKLFRNFHEFCLNHALIEEKEVAEYYIQTYLKEKTVENYVKAEKLLSYVKYKNL